MHRSTPTTAPQPSSSRPVAAAGHGVCRSCSGTGWADPWELGDGTPELTWCDRCLGAGLDGCPDCDGDGTLAVPVLCPCREASAA